MPRDASVCAAARNSLTTKLSAFPHISSQYPTKHTFISIASDITAIQQAHLWEHSTATTMNCSSRFTSVTPSLRWKTPHTAANRAHKWWHTTSAITSSCPLFNLQVFNISWHFAILNTWKVNSFLYLSLHSKPWINIYTMFNCAANVRVAGW